MGGCYVDMGHLLCEKSTPHFLPMRLERQSNREFANGPDTYNSNI